MLPVLHFILHSNIEVLLKLCFKLVDYRRRHLVFIEPEMAKKNGASERLCNNARMVSVAFGKRITHLVMYVPVTI